MENQRDSNVKAFFSIFNMRYGSKSVKRGTHDPFPYQCPGCKKIGTVRFDLYSEYYHFWHVPVFPFEKDGTASCSECDFKIQSLKFNRLTREDFKVINRKFRHPFYTYIGASIILLPVILVIIAILLDSIAG
jgi:hypothetical protein